MKKSKKSREWLDMVEGLPVRIRLNRGQKNTYLKVKPPDGQIILSGPFSLSPFTVKAVIKDHKEDLLKAQKAIVQAKIYQEKTYQDGELHPLWGEEFPLYLALGKKEGVLFKEGGLYLTHRGRDQAGLEKIMEDFYREQMKIKIEGLLEKAKKATGLRPKEWRVRKMKTRWGSCNIYEKRIWLNLHLAKYPEACLYGVLIHELTHLLEKGHTKKFYDLVEKFYPDYKKSQALLKG